MDGETRSFLAEEFKKLNDRITDHANSDLINQQEHVKVINELRAAIGSLPPPGAAGLNGTKPLTVQLQEASKTASNADLTAESLKLELQQMRSELQAQSAQMGIGKIGLEFLKSKEGQALILRGATFLAATIAAWFAAKGH